jgi:hypothetical protein
MWYCDTVKKYTRYIPGVFGFGSTFWREGIVSVGIALSNLSILSVYEQL